MSRETPEWNAQDADDRELLARGAIDELLAGYVDTIQARCRNRCKRHGDDVAQHVCLRLWRELSAGKHRQGKPFREIVNGVVAFACKGYEGAVLGKHESFEEWTRTIADVVVDDVADEAVGRVNAEDFVSSLPPVDQDVARLRMLEGLEIDQIAQQTGRSRNAIDQSLYRIRREWKKWLVN